VNNKIYEDGLLKGAVQGFLAGVVMGSSVVLIIYYEAIFK